MVNLTALHLKAQDAADYVGIPLRDFNNMVENGNGPQFYRPSPRTRLYRRTDLDDWMASWVPVRITKRVRT